MKKLLKVLMVSTVLVFAGCEGDEGPQGPAGPAGANGNANVQTDMVEILPADWKPDNNVLVYKHTSDIINADLYHNGLVQVYMEYNTTSPTSGDKTEYLRLPITFTVGQNQARVDFDYFEQSPDTLRITSQLQWNDTTYFKVVAVGGTLNTDRIKNEVDFDNYEAVKKYFSLED